MTAITTPADRLVYNNISELRLAFASFVVVSHSVQLADLSDLYVLRVIFSSDTAVQAFFILSGFLTFTSFYRGRCLLRPFYVRRLLRICPAYVVAVLLFCVVGVLQALAAGRDVGTPDVAKYLAWNLMFLNFLQPVIPGVFAGNPYEAVNGALWTIKVELGFYLFLPLFYRIGERLSFATIAAAMIVIGVAWEPLLGALASYGVRIHPSMVHQLPGQLQYFGIGALLYWISIEKHRFLPATAVVVVAAAASLALGQPRHAVQILVLSSLVYAVVRLPSGEWYGTHNDLSYGIYLSHFPIIQLLVNWRSWRDDSLVFIPLVFGMAIVYAIVSWALVERPAMSLNRKSGL